MRIVEIVALGVFLALGLRSAWYWIRRPFESADVTDHLLYAMFVTGRVGLWLSVAGAFAIFLSLEASDDAAAYRWYVLVPGLLSFVQLVASLVLGRRGHREAELGGHDRG